ncbi:S24 family peptidase [Novosphingobium sp. BW1]|uniref:S24 family peptidase n=1 Tax=Novosphingobium sp. BW1 TaxID=2592621 RepID=UPI001F07FFF7|nr:S24 family peptidase [Novosphingobium sp. BW1]
MTLRSFDLSYSMGPGANIDDYVEEGTYEFDANMLAKLTRAPVDRLFVARGDGDSMFPTLVNDDTVVIDTTQTVLNLQDRIWACSVYGAGAIKRLRAIAGGKVLVQSDNPNIPDQEIISDDLRIVGRVIWLGRRI